MSKRDNKRFTDSDRKGAPKRGGKNRRDYGETYSREGAARLLPEGEERRAAQKGAWDQDLSVRTDAEYLVLT